MGPLFAMCLSALTLMHKPPARTEHTLSCPCQPWKIVDHFLIPYHHLRLEKPAEDFCTMDGWKLSLATKLILMLVKRKAPMKESKLLVYSSVKIYKPGTLISHFLAYHPPRLGLQHPCSPLPTHLSLLALLEACL